MRQQNCTSCPCLAVARDCVRFPKWSLRNLHSTNRLVSRTKITGIDGHSAPPKPRTVLGCCNDLERNQIAGGLLKDKLVQAHVIENFKLQEDGATLFFLSSPWFTQLQSSTIHGQIREIFWQKWHFFQSWRNRSCEKPSHSGRSTSRYFPSKKQCVEVFAQQVSTWQGSILKHQMACRGRQETHGDTSLESWIALHLLAGYQRRCHVSLRSCLFGACRGTTQYH